MRLVAAELFKARSTRTALGLAAGLLAIVLLFVILHAVLTNRPPHGHTLRLRIARGRVH